MRDTQFEVTEVLVAISKCFGAESVGKAIVKLTGENRAINRDINPLAVTGSVPVVSDVIIAIFKNIIAAAVSYAVQKLADIFFAVCIGHNALAVLLPVMRLPDVFVFLSPEISEGRRKYLKAEEI